MRLVCPSCSAEYEVDATAFGARGRMVRCASCSSEWFQTPPRKEAAAPVEPAAAPEPAPAPTPEPTPEPAAFSAIHEEPPAPEPKAAEYVIEEHAQPTSERIHFDDTEDAVEGSFTVEPHAEDQKPSETDELAASLREPQNEGGGGGAFLAGFATVALVALVAIAVYVKAPDIAALAPAASPSLAAYTDAVDSGRLAIAAFIRG